MAFGPGDDVRVMAQSDSIAGSWAVADSKHRALPIDGQKGSVFLHDGLVGQVRAVGDKTVMVKFPDPIGLVHVKRDDLWNSKPAMARPRWATRQALSLRVAQAIAVPEGLPQLLVDWVDFARKIWSKNPKVQSTATRPRAGYYTVTSGAAPTMVVRIPGNAFEWPYKIETPRSIEVRIYHQNSKDPEAPRQNGNLAHVLISGSKDVEVFISIHKQFRLDIAEHEVQHMVQSLLLRRVQNRGDLGRPGEPDAGLLKRKDGLTDPREIYPYLSQQVAALTQLAKKNGLNTVSLTPHEVEQFLLSDTHGRYRAYKEAHPELWPRVLARFMRELVRAGHTPAGMGTDSLTIPITERYKRVAMPMPTEADLPASWYVKQTTGVTDDDEPEIMWRLYDPEYRYNGQFVPVAALTIVERRPSVWAVSSSFCGIPGGWGAFLYEKALKFVTDRKGWLGSDITVSNSARNVWTKYMDRNDVEKRNRPKEMFPIDSKDTPAVRMMYRFKQKAYLREEDNDGQSAIVAIRVPELLAKDWPDGRGGHDSSPPHVSVVYLGDMRHIPDARDIVSRSVFETVNALPQFEVELEKDVSFFNKDNGDHVAIKKFDATSAENLTKLHDLVKRNLVAAGIPLGEVFEYTPHATLAYQYEPVWPPEMPSPQGSWTVDAVEVWGFDGPDLVFPLRGGGAARTAQVMRTSPRYEPSPAPYYVPSDGYWKGVVNGLGAVVYNSAEWRAGFKYNELGECTWYVIYRLPRGNFIEIDEGYEVSIAEARMRVNRVLANVQHYRDESLPPNRAVPPPLPEGEWKLPQWEDAAPVAFTKPEYTNVKSIYELEYKWSKLNAVRENGPLADRAERALALWTGQLDKALNKELALMQRIFRAWLDARPTDSDDLTINTRLADKLRAVMVTHATQPIPPEIVSGIFASEPRTIDDILVQLPPRSPIRHVISSEYYTWLSRNKARGDTWKSVESMLRLIDDAQSLPISEKIVVFHRALTTAHNNGRMPEHLYGGGDGMNDRNRDADRVLTHLSNMKIPPEWDAELKELLSLPRGASMRMRTAGGMLTLYHYAPDDFEDGVLDPSRFGAGTYTSRDARASDVPRVFFYLNPGDREQWFTGRRLFSAQVPASSIFDIDNGDPKVLDASRTSSGRIDPHELLLNVKGAGYKGIKYDAGGMPLVAYFEPIAVEPVQQEKAAQQQQFGAQPPPLGQSPQPFPQAQQQAQQQSQAQQKPADTGQSSVGLQPLTDPSQKVNNPLMDVGLDSGGQVRVAPPGSGLVTQQVGTINNPGQQLSLKMPATTPAAQQVTDALSGADVGDYQVLIDNAQSGMDVQQLAKSSAKGKKSNKAYLDHDINPITGALEWVLRSPHGVDVRWFGHMKPTPETVEAVRRGGIVDRVFESEAETDTDTVSKDEMAQVLFGSMDYESPDDREVAAIEFAHADITPDSQKLLRSKDTWPQRTTYHNDSKVTRQTLDHHDLVSGGVGYSNIMAVMSEATPQEIESYGAWYGLGHDQALMISEESGVPLDRVCAVIALLSPGMKWENNLQAARRMCLGEPLAGSGGAFPMNVLKALRVLRGSSIEKTIEASEKVRPFYETLLSPEKSAEKAVVDRHMFAIWFGDPSVKMVDDPSVRALIQRDVQLAAREWNLPVQAIQAITWAIWRQRTNIPRPDDEPHPNEPDAPPSDYDYDLMKQGELQLTAGRYEDVLARYPDRKGLVDFFVNNDPTNGANVYLAWMMEQALKNPNGGTADVQSIAETVGWFHRRKEALKPSPQNAQPRDINSWKSVDNLHAALTALGKSRSQKKVEGSKIVGQADGWTFYRVLDQAAACLLAKGTTWCIGADKNNMYDYYEHLGDTYIAIKGNEKWAIHTKRDTLEAARVTSPRNTEPLHTEWGSMWPAAEKVGFSVPMLEFTLDGYSWPDDRRRCWRVYIDDPDAFGEQVWELTAEIDDPFYLDVVHAEFRTANMQNKTAISLFLELCTDVFVKPLGVPGQRRLGNCMDLTGPVATLWALATEVTVNRELQNDTVKDDDNAEVLHTASRRIAMPGVSRDDVVNHFNSINPLKSTGYDPWSRTYEGLEWSGPVEFAVDDARLEDGGVTGYMNMPKERAVVEQYAERIRAGEKMPALIIVEGSRGDLGVADGGHRLEAARLAGLKTVPAYIGLKPNTRISLTAERLPSKSRLWALLTESLPERAVSKDMAIHDGAYARWQQPYAKYRSTRPVFTGGELDALNDALDLKGDARVSGPREAFDRLTRNARTWDDIARVVKLFNAVPGFESMHIPERVMLQDLDEQERDWYAQEEAEAEAAAQDDKPLSDEERAQLPDDAFDFDPERLSRAASMRTAVRAGDLGIKDLRRWTESNGTWAMLSASQQGSLHQRKLQHRKLLRQLQELGVKPSMIVPVRGRWYENGQERAEQSLWVKGLDFDQAVKLGKQFDQDAVIFKSDDGVVGMYDLRNGRVRVPAQSGDPVFGDEAIDVAQRGPKVSMPGKGYVPSPEDLYTRGKSTSMSVRYDWDDAKSEFVHDLKRPLSRADVERLYRKREGAVRTAMPHVPDEFAQRLRMTLTPDLLKPEWRKKHEQACDPMTGHCYAAAEAAYHALGGAEAGWKPMHIKHEDAPHWYLQHADGTVFDPTASQFQEPPDYVQGRGKGFLTKAPSARARKILERMQPKIAMPMPRQLPAGWRLKAPPTLAGDYYIMTPENIPAAWLRLVKPRYSPTEAYVARVENNYVDTVPGLGAYLYQHVMDKATREGVWLRSDTQVSDKARGVWKKFHDREDVVKEPRDNLPGDPGSIWKFDPKNLDADEDAGTWEPETAPELFHKYKLKIS